jgi:hypothetical protein
MAGRLLVAGALMASSVTIHAYGVSAALRWLRRQAPPTRAWPVTWLFIRLAAAMIGLHLAEVTAWAVVYDWRGAMPDLQTAWYFSAVTFTTTGYGDLLLPPDWRLVGAVQALTGILLCGWSTGFFFAAVSRVSQTRAGTTESSPERPTLIP